MIHNIDDIVNTVSGIKRKMESALPAINSEIDVLIKADERSQRKIERILDILIDYAQLGVGKSEFEKLNSYYSLFNEENAGIYKRFYQEWEKD
jgi:hypothetical protein